MTPEQKAVKFALDRLLGKSSKEARISIMEEQQKVREQAIRRVKTRRRSGKAKPR